MVIIQVELIIRSLLMGKLLLTGLFKPTLRAGLFGLLIVFSSSGIAWTLGSNLHDAFPDLTPHEVSSLITDDQTYIYDVNTISYRTAKGIVPGAITLKNYNYNTTKKLPTDKDAKLVFYCSNTYCTSAPLAAKNAQEAGYTDVNVMAVGIDGWLAAGFKTEIY